MLHRFCDISIWLGICATLIISPLMVGSTTVTGISIITVLVLFSFFIFILRAYIGKEFKLTASHIEIPLLLFIVYVACQIALEINDLNNRLFFGTIYKYATLNSVLKLTLFFLFYVLVVNMLKSGKDILRLVWIVAITGGVVSLVAVTQKASGRDIFQLIGIDRDRSFFSTFVNRNQFSGYVEMAFCATMSLFCFKLGHTKDLLNQSGKKRNGTSFVRIIESGAMFVFILLCIMLVAVFISLSRTGMALIILTIFIFYIFFMKNQIYPVKKRFLLMLFEFIIFFAVITVLFLGLDPVINRFSDITSFQVRLAVDVSTLKIILKHPVFGTGYGTFRYIFQQFQTTFLQYDMFFTRGSNNYLELLSETGLIGFFIFMTGAVFFFKKNRLSKMRSVSDRIFRYGALTGIMLIGIHCVSGYDVLTPSNTLLFFSMIAVVYASGIPDNNDKDNAKMDAYIVRINSRRTIFFVVLPSYLFLSFLIVKTLVGIFLAEHAVNSKTDNKVYLYMSAISKDPMNADYKFRLSQILLSRAVKDKKGKDMLLEEGLKLAEETVKMSPTNAAYLYNTARILTAMKQLNRAEEFFLRAIDYAPIRYGYRMGYAVFCFNRAYRTRSIGFKKLFIKRGLDQYNKSKEILDCLEFLQYKKNFLNYEKQIKEIEKYGTF